MGKQVFGITLGIGVVFVAVVFSIALGATTIPFSLTLDILSQGIQPAADVARHLEATIWAPGTEKHQLFTASISSSVEQVVVNIHSRVLRTGVACIAGSAMSCAGVGLQGITRNGLADAGLVGINAGAALAVVLATLYLGLSTPTYVMAAAFAGGLAVSFILYVITVSRNTSSQAIDLLLAGTTIAAVCASITSAILIHQAHSLYDFRRWTLGIITGRSWDLMQPVIPICILGVLLLLAQSRALNSLALGDEIAAGLGVNIKQTRIIVLLSSVGLASAAVAIAGPISFLGMLIPHTVRLLGFRSYSMLITLSFIFGPIFIVLADIAGRIIAPPGEVPAGIMIAMMGGPFFVWLVRRQGGVTL